MADEFHLFLPSNTNPDICPENTPSDYTTVYNENIKLEGNWEVGVKSLSYPSKIDTFSSEEQMISGRNLCLLVDGKYLNGDEKYYDFQSCNVERPKSGLQPDGRYKPEEIADVMNNCEFGKRGLITTVYLKDKNRFVVQIKGGPCLMAVSPYLYLHVLCLPRLGDGYQCIKSGPSYWSSGLFRGDPFGEDQWRLILFPTYRLEKEVFTICEKDEGELTPDDLLDRLNAACRGRVKFTINRKRFPGYCIFVTNKPNCEKDNDFNILQFNNAAMDMLGVYENYFQPTIHDWQYQRMWRHYDKFSDCKFFEKESIQLTVWHRKIVNHSNCVPDSHLYEHNIPRNRFTNDSAMISFLNTFDKEQRKKDSQDYEFSIDKKTSRVVLTIKNDVYLKLDQVTADILGFKTKIFPKKNTRYIAEFRPRLDRAVDFLFVYGNNLTDPVFVGNVKAPLLCIIPHEKGNENTETFTQLFSNPTYIPISRYTFNQLRITVRDDAGSLIPFSNAKTILGLHFRKRL